MTTKKMKKNKFRFHALFLVLLVIGSLGVLVFSNANKTTGFQILTQTNENNQVNSEINDCPIFVEESENVACPNQQVCEDVCELKALELSANDEAYNEFGLPSEMQANWNGKSCSCTVYYGPSEGEILYHDSKMPINSERYCGKNGMDNLNADIDQADKNIQSASTRRYYRAANNEGRTKVINEVLKQKSCDGNTACKGYCEHELYQCKVGERRANGYPKNDCADYDKAKQDYDLIGSSCYCSFLNNNFAHDVYELDPLQMTPSTTSYFCDVIQTNKENENLCSDEEVCGHTCSLMLYDERQIHPEYSRKYEYKLNSQGCSCLFSNADSTEALNKNIPLKTIEDIAANKDLCTLIRNEETFDAKINSN
ncbi:hypothetical protein HZA97_06435 [Candidatus Woesearchaeota archaeon]|nr:hypothetical protein [Candidatus Woesearchaeota archaeon]